MQWRVACRCMIVKTDTHIREQISKVVQLRANIEGLKLGPGVVERLATEGEKSSLRSVLVLSRCELLTLSPPSPDMHCSCSRQRLFWPNLRAAARSRWKMLAR